MSKRFKGFLVPVATAAAALTGSAAEASIEKTTPPSDQVEPQQKNVVPAGGITFTLGDELHSLILAPNEQGVMLAAHGSHQSHASHQSHRSHYSSRS